jgi:hypothetical protein
MKRRTAIILILSSGLMGLIIGVVITRFGVAHKETYVLRKDLDLGTTYFFGANPPLKGKVLAGSKVEVEFRYSRADYVAFCTVVDRDVLTQIAIPVAEK